MFEQLGLGVRFEFENYGRSNILDAMSDMNGLYDVCRDSGQVFSSMQQNFETTTNQIQSISKAMMAVGTGMTTTFAMGIKSAANFESELAGLKKYMSDTSATGIAEFNTKLSESAKELGVAKTSIMEAAQEYMAMGLAQDKALEMASAVTKAGKIWDVASQEAAEAFKGISAAYNMDFVNSEQVRNDFVDMINYVADNTALVGKDSLNFLSAAGASLKTMGNTSMEGALGIASAAAKAQVDITHLGYGMNTMIRRYAEKGDTYFKTVGLEAKDASGNLKPFNEMLDELAGKVKKGAVDTTQLSDFASNLGGVYASDLLRIINAWDEYDKTMSAISSKDYAGSAQAEWETITNTFEHQANITKVIWTDFIQATFGQVLPAVTQLVKVFNTAFSALTTFLSAHPKISAFATAMFGLTGVALILGGAFMFITTKISTWLISMQTAQAAGFAFSGMLSTMKVHFGNVLSMIPTLTKGLFNIGLTFGLVYLTMKYDILGIRSMFEKFVSTIKNAFTDSKAIISGSASFVSSSLQKMDQSTSIGDKLTGMFSRIGIAWQALKDMWNDYELSDEMYDKLVASGMEPVVTSIMMLVYRLRETWRGFKDGFIGMCGVIRNFIMTVLAPPFNWLKDNIIVPALQKIQDFMIKVGLMAKDSSLLNSASSNWYKFGKAIGELGPFIVLIGLFSKIVKYAGVLKTVFSPLVSILTSPFKLLGSILGKIPGLFTGIIDKIALIGINIGNLVRGNMRLATFIGDTFPRLGTMLSGVWNVIKTLGSGISSIFGGLKSVILGVLGAIGTVITSILGACGIVVTLPAWVVGAIAVAVVAAIGLIWHFRDEIMEFFGSIGQWIVQKWKEIWNSDWFAPVRNVMTKVVNGIKEIFSPVVEFFSETWTAVCDFFKTIWDSTVGFAKGIWDDICADVSSMKDTLLGFWGEIKDGVASIWENIKEKFQPVIDGFETVKSKTQECWNAVSPVLQQIGSTIKDVASGIWSFIQPIISAIVSFVMSAFGAIRDAVLPGLTIIYNTILSVLTSIWNIISSVFMSIFNTIVGILSAIWNTIVSIVNTIVTFISTTLQSLWSIISGILDIITGVFTMDLDKIWQGVQSVFNGIFSFIGGILTALWGLISSILSGIAGVFSAIWSGISSAVIGIVSGLVSAVSSFFSGLWSALTSIVSSIYSSVTSFFSSMAGTLSGIVSGIVSAITGFFTSLIGGLASIVSQISASVCSGFRSLVSQAGSAVSGIVSTVSGYFTGMVSSAFSWGSNLISGFINGIKSMAGAVGNAVSSVVNSAKDFIGFHSPSKKGEGRHIVEWGANMIGGFIDGIDSAVPALMDTMAKVIQAPDLNGNVTVSTKAIPTSDYDTTNRQMVDGIYRDRTDLSGNTYNDTNNNNNGMSLVFNEGAIKFALEGVTDAASFVEQSPEIQGMLQQAVLDLVKKLKNQQYEK